MQRAAPKSSLSLAAILSLFIAAGPAFAADPDEPTTTDPVDSEESGTGSGATELSNLLPSQDKPAAEVNTVMKYLDSLPAAERAVAKTALLKIASIMGDNVKLKDLVLNKNLFGGPDPMANLNLLMKANDWVDAGGGLCSEILTICTWNPAALGPAANATGQGRPDLIVETMDDDTDNDNSDKGKSNVPIPKKKPGAPVQDATPPLTNEEIVEKGMNGTSAEQEAAAKELARRARDQGNGNNGITPLPGGGSSWNPNSGQPHPSKGQVSAKVGPGKEVKMFGTDASKNLAMLQKLKQEQDSLANVDYETMLADSGYTPVAQIADKLKSALGVLQGINQDYAVDQKSYDDGRKMQGIRGYDNGITGRKEIQTKKCLATMNNSEFSKYRNCI